MSRRASAARPAMLSFAPSAAAARSQRSQHLVLYSAGRSSRRRWRQLLRRARQADRHRRRIGLRQDRQRALDHAAVARRRPRRRRLDHLRRHRFAEAERTRDARDPRRADRDDLSGADDLAQSGLHHRQPDRRGDPAPSAHLAPRDPRSHDRGAADGRHRRSRAAHQRLSASTVRRDAPARDDRDGARVRAPRAHRRRADHRPRRHDSGADSRSHSRAAVAPRPRGNSRHARPRHRRSIRRRRHHPLCRAGDGAGADRRPFRQSAESLHQGLARLDPRHRRLTPSASAGHPGFIPGPLNPPTGCRFHPRCPLAIDDCSRVDPPLERKAPNHYAACIRV